MALRDPATGLPTLIPSAAACGLPEHLRFDAARSFLRVRRYSPWNGTRKRPDLERQVIVAGSVLTWNVGDGSLDDLEKALRLGLGEHTSAGLGQVVCNPGVLAHHAAELPTASGPSSRAAAGTPALPADPLAQWMARKHQEAEKADKTWQVANDLAKAASGWGVARSQWGNLRALASQYILRADDLGAREALTKAVHQLWATKVSESAWGARGVGGLKQAMQSWLPDESLHFASALHILARRAVRAHGPEERAPAQEH
jgi:hypothetical protein